MKNPDRKTVVRLEELPNIGKAIAGDLHLIGIRCPKDLTGKNAYELYNELCAMTGKKHDPCVIDVFLSVVDFMNGSEPAPWWNYTAERKKNLSMQI